jgi:hypothetical protein
MIGVTCLPAGLLAELAKKAHLATRFLHGLTVNSTDLPAGEPGNPGL